MAESVSTDCKTGRSEIAATETFTEIQGMSCYGLTQRELAVCNNADTLLHHLCERPVYTRTRKFLRQVATISAMRDHGFKAGRS